MEFAYPAAAGQLHSVPGFYVEERTVLSDEDFEAATADYPFTPTGLTLVVRLTPAGAARILHETKGRIGSYLATLLDSRLVGVAQIASPVGNDPDVPIFMGLRLPDRVAFEAAARIAARWPR
jgi:preprotein translocase subunit SecD